MDESLVTTAILSQYGAAPKQKFCTCRNTKNWAGHDGLPANVRTAIIRSKIPKRGAKKEFFSTALVAFANQSEICALCRKTK
jgi:hypothetical protein